MNHYHHRKRIFTAAIAVILFLLSAVLLLRTITSLSETAFQAQADVLQNALKRSAVHCYAAEGRYPESLEYLQEIYGITWDSEQYVVDYEVFASNLLPVISVIPIS